MLKPIWRFHRWFDDLEKMGMGGERFIIFLTLIVFFMMLFPMIGTAMGFPFFGGQMVGLLFFIPFGLTRIYWIEYYKHK